MTFGPYLVVCHPVWLAQVPCIRPHEVEWLGIQHKLGAVGGDEAAVGVDGFDRVQVVECVAFDGVEGGVVGQSGEQGSGVERSRGLAVT